MRLYVLSRSEIEKPARSTCSLRATELAVVPPLRVPGARGTPTQPQSSSAASGAGCVGAGRRSLARRERIRLSAVRPGVGVRVAGCRFEPVWQALTSGGPSRHRHGQFLDGMIQHIEPEDDLVRRDIRVGRLRRRRRPERLLIHRRAGRRRRPGRCFIRRRAACRLRYMRTIFPERSRLVVVGLAPILRPQRAFHAVIMNVRFVAQFVRVQLHSSSSQPDT